MVLLLRVDEKLHDVDDILVVVGSFITCLINNRLSKFNNTEAV